MEENSTSVDSLLLRQSTGHDTTRESKRVATRFRQLTNHRLFWHPSCRVQLPPWHQTSLDQSTVAGLSLRVETLLSQARGTYRASGG